MSQGRPALSRPPRSARTQAEAASAASAPTLATPEKTAYDARSAREKQRSADSSERVDRPLDLSIDALTTAKSAAAGSAGQGDGSAYSSDIARWLAQRIDRQFGEQKTTVDEAYTFPPADDARSNLQLTFPSPDDVRKEEEQRSDSGRDSYPQQQTQHRHGSRRQMIRCPLQHEEPLSDERVPSHNEYRSNVTLAISWELTGLTSRQPVAADFIPWTPTRTRPVTIPSSTGARNPTGSTKPTSIVSTAPTPTASLSPWNGLRVSNTRHGQRLLLCEVGPGPSSTQMFEHHNGAWMQRASGLCVELVEKDRTPSYKNCSRDLSQQLRLVDRALVNGNGTCFPPFFNAVVTKVDSCANVTLIFSQ
ncbi:hypothetical protein DFJ73DRAFT_757669 [Zopfochytrium polystomum]|nr:hypothetical protein DFJ73DRAFT_757669 [Zopfochytrium polystomum]